MASTLNDDVKLALRITTSALDGEIDADIAAAKAELERAGVDADLITEEGPLVVQAIKTYVMAVMAPELSIREGFYKSFEIICDNLRKSVVNVDV